jgi:hypothetical protein
MSAIVSATKQAYKLHLMKNVSFKLAKEASLNMSRVVLATEEEK